MSKPSDEPTPSADPPAGSDSPDHEAPPEPDTAPAPPRPARAVPKVKLAAAAAAAMVTIGVALAMCNRTPEPTELTVVSDAMAEASAKASATVAVVDAAPPPCPESEYKVRLTAGRAAMAKRKYGDARTELDAALVCRPDDPEALTSLGISWYYSDELGNANKELALAARHAKTPWLLGQIWYMRGLIDERELGQGSGKADFAAAFALGRHQGAKEKLKDDELCGASIQRYSREKTNGSAFFEPTVQEVIRSLEGLPDGADVAAMAPTEPEVFHFSGTGYGTYDWLVAKGAKDTWAFKLAESSRVYHCYGDGDFKVDDAAPGFVHATGHYVGPNPIEPTGGGQPGCGEDNPYGVDVFFDPKRELGLVVSVSLPGRYEERADLPHPKVTISKKGVTVKGLGCDLFEPWVEPQEDGGADATSEAGADAAAAADATRD